VKLQSALRSRTTAVATGALVIGLAATGGGAVAAGLVTSHDIADGAVHSRDIHHNGVHSDNIKTNAVHTSEIRNGSVHGKDLRTGLLAKINAPGPQGPAGPAGPAGTASYVGPNWSIIDRNVIGNGDAYLRAGPSVAGGVKPPMGVGSLGIRTGSNSDQVMFGDQVDFAGQALSSLNTESYWVFTTGEDNAIAANNLPSVEFEVNPHTSSSFSTLVFAPASAPSNAWTKLDASTAKQWYYTGGFGTSSGCNQTTYCTLADAEAAAPNGTLLTAEISKGRDYAFSGAVDALQINNKVYDFEPFGVTASNAS
jgi:hypothetical protein